jgi:hypothetical protein
MHWSARRLPLGAALTALVSISGCGDSHPPVDSSTTPASVKGVVKVRGKLAVGGGQISFNPSNVERKVPTAIAKIADDGSYSLSSLTGGNEVKFSGPFLKDDPGVALTSRYCELHSGENVIDFDLLGPEDTPRGAIYPKGSIPTNAPPPKRTQNTPNRE